jgi:hypothetical protein
MRPLLYVIDEEFTNQFTSAYGGPEEEFADCHVKTRSDVHAGTTTQVAWSQCVESVAMQIREYGGPLVLVLGHKGIFRNVLPTLDLFKAEGRVNEAERDLLKDVGSSTPAIHVSGFHHVPDSPIYLQLSKPRLLDSPGGFTRLRILAEHGGGPLARLSVLRHNMMRPFASMRLRLQLDMESGIREIDRTVIERVVSAIADGRTQLATLDSGYYDDSSEFVDAVRNARSLLDESVDEITADPAVFNEWVDRLTDALDVVRQEAR